jgi:hypothetical protein
VSTNTFREILVLFLLSIYETKNYFPPINVIKSSSDRLYLRKPRKESFPRLLRFPPSSYLY